MSSAADGTNTMICVSCGSAGGDDIKLKQCACHLVKYCSVKCQKDHRPQHKKECKKRVAELKDEMLFKQPESSNTGDCPICYLPVSLDPKKSVLYSCCCKFICMGCDYANKKREIEGRLQQKCAFCRKAVPSTDEEENEQWMQRLEANDPMAMCYMGSKKSIEGDHESAFEYFTKAAAMGDAEAHYHLFGRKYSWSRFDPLFPNDPSIYEKSSHRYEKPS